MAERSESASARHPTSVERKSEREVVARRIFDAPACLVFEAWTRPELFRQWWVPKSVGLVLLSLEQDVRVGSGYRFVFDLGDSTTMAFFGKYIDVTPPHSPILDERGRRRRGRDHRHVRGKGRADTLDLLRVLPDKGSTRPHHREDGRAARAVRATGRVAPDARLTAASALRSNGTSMYPLGTEISRRCTRRGPLTTAYPQSCC